mmetsp:Transcript_33987/g.30765  ORF Transcript_33987/g.30765 Transcript_33987/m.30765 type:complete len:116 (-) Transcript_33987:1558-1905(-)
MDIAQKSTKIPSGLCIWGDRQDLFTNHKLRDKNAFFSGRYTPRAYTQVSYLPHKMKCKLYPHLKHVTTLEKAFSSDHLDELDFCLNYLRKLPNIKRIGYLPCRILNGFHDDEELD